MAFTARKVVCEIRTSPIKISHFIRREIAGEIIHFFAGKAAYWERAGTLLVADLHWGKAAVFRSAGIPIPEDVLDADLRRLGILITEARAERVLVLGDLVHATKGLTASSIDLITTWRRHLPVAFSVVTGNHDRGFQEMLRQWGIDDLGVAVEEGPFCFRHEPIVSTSHYVWAGHVHPMFCLQGQGDKIRLPCFWLRAGMTVLPSFSLLTRGSNISLEVGETALMVNDQGVFPVGGDRASVGTKGYRSPKSRLRRGDGA